MCCWVGLWTSQRSWWSDLLLTAENITTERKQCVGVWMGALCRSFTGCADLYLWPRCVSRADGRAAPASSVVSVGAGLTNRPTASCSPSCCCLVKADISVKKQKQKEKSLSRTRERSCVQNAEAPFHSERALREQAGCSAHWAADSAAASCSHAGFSCLSLFRKLRELIGCRRWVGHFPPLQPGLDNLCRVM